ncbi:MAG: hypothetical protein AAB502_07375, partial [Chloroflexota bacterium]
MTFDQFPLLGYKVDYEFPLTQAWWRHFIATDFENSDYFSADIAVFFLDSTSALRSWIENPDCNWQDSSWRAKRSLPSVRVVGDVARTCGYDTAGSARYILYATGTRNIGLVLVAGITKPGVTDANALDFLA